MLVEITSEQLLAMTNPEILAWAWANLGIAMDPSWPRSKILSRLMDLAYEVR